MRFDIELQIQGLRCLKGIFSKFEKCLFFHKQMPKIFLIYFLDSKQVRFLVDSEECKAIIAIHPSIITKNQSSQKQGVEILSFQLKNSKQFFMSYEQIIQIEGAGQVAFNLNKQKSNNNSQPFRCFTMSFFSTKLRSQIQKPAYDAQDVINHSWLNGCIPQERKVQFDVSSQHVLIFLKMASKYKELKQINDQKVIMELNFELKRMILTFSNSKHNSKASIIYLQVKAPQYKGNYTFQIKLDDVKKVYEFFLQKSPGSRMYINKDNEIVMAHFNQGTFESQILMKTWIQFIRFDFIGGEGNGLKMQI